MARFVQQNWVVIFFVGAMLAMHLRHRGGHQGGMGGYPGATGHQDTSSVGHQRPESDSRTGIDVTSGPPAEDRGPNSASNSDSHSEVERSAGAGSARSSFVQSGYHTKGTPS